MIVWSPQSPIFGIGCRFESVADTEHRHCVSLPTASETVRIGFPSHPPRASAGVAVHLIPVATTVQLARRQGWVVRGFALESAAAQVCREAGARVSTNVLVRDLDLLPLQHADARRLEVVADGLPLCHGAQIAVDTTLVYPLRRNSTPHSRCAWEDGAASRQARRRKECIQNSPVHMEEPDWLFSQIKLEADGPWRRKLSSSNLHGRSLVRNIPISGTAPNWHGPGDGA